MDTVLKYTEVHRSCQFSIKWLVKYITVSIYLSRRYTSLVRSLFWKFVRRKKSPNQQKFLLEYLITFPSTGARLFWVLVVFPAPTQLPSAFPTWSSTTLRLRPPQLLVLPLPVPLTPRSVTNPGLALGGDRWNSLCSVSFSSFHPNIFTQRRLGHSVH